MCCCFIIAFYLCCEAAGVVLLMYLMLLTVYLMLFLMLLLSESVQLLYVAAEPAVGSIWDVDCAKMDALCAAVLSLRSFCVVRLPV